MIPQTYDISGRKARKEGEIGKVREQVICHLLPNDFT
jgi:hypothetical protein